MHEPIRVLHVVNKMNQGGIQSLIMNYYRNIDRSRIQFDFVVQDNGGNHYDREIKTLGGKIHGVPRMTTHSVRAFSRAFGEILERNPDYQIVHSHQNWLNIVPLRISKKYGVPIRLSHSHGSYGARSFYRKAQRYLFQETIGYYATDFLSCSTVAGIWLYGERFTSDPRARVVHNAIDTNKFQFNKVVRDELRRKHEFGPRTHVLINVGRLSPGKNHEFLIDVFSEYQKINPDSILVLAGDGPSRSHIERKVEKMGLRRNVLFLGMIDNVHEYLSAADLFVFPSSSEGLGIALVEAQTNGLPAIVSSEGIPQEADAAKTAVFCSLDESAYEWANCVHELKDVDRTDNLSSIVNAGYDIRKEAQQLQDFYLVRIRDVVD